MKNASRDEEILRHLGLYRISIRPVLSRLFFAGRDPGNVLQRLRAAGLVQEWPKRRASDAGARAGFLTGLSYYQLTVAGALGRVPLTRAAPLNTRALHKHFAVLWWTCPQPADTSDVGVSPRGGCSNGEENGEGTGAAPRTAIVHAHV